MREFRARPGCSRDFEQVFATNGVWVELLRPRSSGYRGTEVKAIAPDERMFEVRDYWRSHSSFELFRHWYQGDIERFRDWLADRQMVEFEKFVGAFYVSETDEGNDTGLVSA